MTQKHEPTTSSGLGGAPGGLGGTTGADPRTPAAGMQHPQTSEDRSFQPTEPGHTSDIGEGGGAMSGRPQENRPDNGRASLGPVPTGSGASRYDPQAGEPGPGVSGGGTNETAGTGENSVGGTGAAAGGDAHLGHDGRKLGDPANANRQVHSDDSGDIANGSGAD